MPLIMVPATRPRAVSSAWPTAYGTSTCATTLVRPTPSAPTASTGTDGATAMTARLTDVSDRTPVTSGRRSTTSPSGTTSSSPTA
jgi:hypothetical protein